MLCAMLALAVSPGPMFFAGGFAKSFGDSAEPDMAFGSNIAASAFGGLSESLLMLVGFRYLLLPAIAFYLVGNRSCSASPGDELNRCLISLI